MTGKQTVERFYAAFDAHDGDTMAGLYAPGASFRDPAFGDLSGEQAGDMWRMLTSRAADLRVELPEVADDGTTARWIAHYTFAQTGRKVVNDIQARFRFAADGRIADHVDDFSFHAWSRQALGLPGLLLGWTPILQGAVRRKARGQLEAYRAAGGSTP